MILAFDLDDTLYSEQSYVKSGLSAVADYLTETYLLHHIDVYAELCAILARDGRGKIFDTFTQSANLYNARLVRQCLSVYRLHTPDIKLFDETLPVLQSLKMYPLYLVTDGNKVVQDRKVNALELSSHFQKVFITHRYGIRHAKPSIYCFDKFRCAEQSHWYELVYVGDNPHKDFVNLNKLGAITVRVRTGAYAKIVAKPGYDAKHSIDHIRDLPTLLNNEYALELSH